MKTKILLLDIDGVLNDHSKHPNGYCGINPVLVSGLNRIVAATSCHIVIVSAWRYMILGGQMTLKGFQYLLAIHGASQETCDAVIGYLPQDINTDTNTRGLMCKNWLQTMYLMDGAHRLARVVALDDLDLGYKEHNIPLVQTDGKIGLSRENEAAVVEMLS